MQAVEAIKATAVAHIIKQPRSKAVPLTRRSCTCVTARANLPTPANVRRVSEIAAMDALGRDGHPRTPDDRCEKIVGNQGKPMYAWSGFVEGSVMSRWAKRIRYLFMPTDDRRAKVGHRRFFHFPISPFDEHSFDLTTNATYSIGPGLALSVQQTSERE
jgi:hypothetical protein